MEAKQSSGQLRKQIWAIGGGKGGVGKSLISSSIAYTLAKLGHTTIAIDADLGGANLHTVLGQPPPARGLSDYFQGKVTQLKDCICATAYPNLKIIAGASDDLNVTQISDSQRHQFLKDVKNLDAQFIILDLGAGTNSYTLDFFTSADVGVITVLPEPTSIENAYRFLKAAYYHRLLVSPQFGEISSLVESAMSPNHANGIKSPGDLLAEVQFQNPVLAQNLKSSIREFKPKLLLNQTRTQSDIDVGFSMRSVTKKYFGIDLEYLGYLEYEPNVWQSVRKMKPILAEHPNSRIAGHFERICQHLLKQARHEESASLTAASK